MDTITALVALLAAVVGIIAVIYQIRNHRLAARNLEMQNEKLRSEPRREPSSEDVSRVNINAGRDAYHVDQSRHYRR